MTSGIAHGGALDQAMARHGGQRADWLDLSTGINPVAWPVPALAPELWQRLPEAIDLTACLDVARRCYGVPDVAAICAAPGTQAIIQWLPHLLPGGHADVVVPTYGEYEHCFGSRARQAATLAEVDAPIVIAGNPNNPDGRFAYWASVVRHLDRGATVVVDEAFADVAPDASLVPHAGRRGLLILRSFGKFFGLAGLRLGFAIGHPEIIAALASRLGPWAVPGPALSIGAAALADDTWIAVTRSRLAEDRHHLDEILLRHDFEIVGGTDLFVTAARLDAAAVHEALAARHILVRRFDYAPDWLRFGLLADAAGFARLDAALAAPG